MADPIRQLLSQTSYNGDGSTTVWNFSFSDGYIDRSHVKASVMNKATGTINYLTLVPGQFIGPNTLSITPPIAAGYELTIFRDTPKGAPLVNFADRAALTESSLDLNARQCVMVAAEASDGLSTAISSVSQISRLAENVVAFTGQAQGYASAAAGSAASAAGFAGQANGAASQASASAGQADGSAIAAKGYRDATLIALQSVANGPVLSVAGRQGTVTAIQLKSDLNIGNVDNTSDFLKPLSQAATNALAAKVSLVGTGYTALQWMPGDGLRLTVDATPFGSRWPISISGRADAAGYADSANSAASANYANSAGAANTANYAATSGQANYASTANNANGLGGRGVEGWVSNITPGNNLSLAWDGNAIVGRVDGQVNYLWTEWSRVVNRPTDLASFGNSPRYVQRYGQYGVVDVAAPDGQQVVGRALPNVDNRIAYLSVISGGIGCSVDGQSFSWPINPSDERLKENILDTAEDTLDKLRRLVFKSFRYNVVSPMMEGIERKAGLIAQQVQEVEPEWITHAGDFRQLNSDTLLTAALHAIQQLDKEVADLKAKLNEHSS